MARKETKARKLPEGFTRRPDGRLEYRFSVNGKRYSIYGETEKECRRKAKKRIEEIAEGTYKPRKKGLKSGKQESFREFSARWLEEKSKKRVKDATILNKTRDVNSICEMEIDEAGHKFGDLKLHQIETQHVIDLQTKLSEKYSTSTTNIRIGTVKNILEKAVLYGILQRNPARAVEGLGRTEEAARDTIHRALTKDETAAFLEEAKRGDSWSYYNLYVVLLHTGMRIGEAGALCAADINDKGLMVKRTVTKDREGKLVIGEDTKTKAGIRFIPLDAEARKAIKDQMAIETELNGKVISLTEPIFKTEHGGILSGSHVYYDVNRICKKTGVERFTVHALRDTFITRCYESGMSVKELQEIAGHSDVQMTLGLYAHSNDDRKIEAMQAVKFG